MILAMFVILVSATLAHGRVQEERAFELQPFTKRSGLNYITETVMNIAPWYGYRVPYLNSKATTIFLAVRLS